MKSFRIKDAKKLTLWLFQYKDELWTVFTDGITVTTLGLRGGARDEFLTQLATNTEAV